MYKMEFQWSTAYRTKGEIIEVDTLGTAIALERDRVAKVIENREQFIDDVMNSGYSDKSYMLY